MKRSMVKKILCAVLVLTMTLGSFQLVSAAVIKNQDIKNLVDEMSLRDKVTQMLMVDFRYWDEDLNDEAGKTGFTVMNQQVQKIVEDYNFGALIYFAQNLADTEQAYHLTMAMQEAATKDGGIPMIISADQEGGSVYRLNTGTALPGNMALGATGSEEYALAVGQIIGSELSALGINTTLAPVVDVNNNANNPVIGLRSYSDDANLVGKLASATIQGLAQNNVIGCAKHFPGHGDTATDSHYGLPSVDKPLDELLENELKPYQIAIDQGIEMIMTAHILYPQLEADSIVSAKTGKEEKLPATMSDDILTGLLKGDMGFNGIVVTDAMNMEGIAANWDQVQAVTVAIQAGVDMICMPCTLYDLEDLENLDAIISGVMKAVEEEYIPMSRINDAVTRILTVKKNRGILDYNADDYSLEYALATVGSDENREKERVIAAEAVTVIKNENNVLPLDIASDTNVLMLVPYNNERGQMIMGWNRAVEAGNIPSGSKVDCYRFNSNEVDEVLQEKLDWADVIIVNSEVSSASKMGYKHWLSAFPNKVADYCYENNKISVILSVDKPYDVQLYPNADAVLAVYGCKGSSVDPTEAIVGGITGSEAAYGPNIIAGVEVALGTFGAKGTLPVDVPLYNESTGAYEVDRLVFKRGFGLAYDAKTPFRFEDVMDEDKYYFDSVYWAVQNGITSGVSETMFDPDGSCTRAQIVSFLYRMAGEPEVSKDLECKFIDVAESKYYYDAVMWAVEQGITSGVTKTTFKPDKICSRAEAVAFLHRYNGDDYTGETVFEDVNQDAWFYNDIAWAVAEGITAGTTKTTFSPADNCTRAQVISFLYRYEH